MVTASAAYKNGGRLHAYGQPHRGRVNETLAEQLLLAEAYTQLSKMSSLSAG